MLYPLAPETVKERKARTWYAVGTLTLLSLFLISLFCFTSLPQSRPSLFHFLLFICAMLFFPWVILLATALGMKTKTVNEVETQADSFTLISSATREEVPYTSITKLFIGSNLEGEVQTLFLSIRQKPMVSLRGYTGMDGLALELEKKVSDPALVTKTRRNVTPTQRLKGGLVVGGVVIGIVGIALGVLFLMVKMGFGFLLGPFCVVAWGASHFASNRGNKKKRLLGIAIIFGGLLFAALKFYELLLNSSKGS
jgi:hypothetical protein